MAHSHCSTGKALPSEHTHGHETLVEELHVEVCKSPDYRPHLEALADAIYFLALSFMEGITIMSNDFTALSAAIDNVTAEIAAAVAILSNPAVDNNDQSVIDALTAKLTGAASTLGGALPAAPAPVETPAPTDGTGSTDVTP